MPMLSKQIDSLVLKSRTSSFPGCTGLVGNDVGHIPKSAVESGRIHKFPHFRAGQFVVLSKRKPPVDEGCIARFFGIHGNVITECARFGPNVRRHITEHKEKVVTNTSVLQPTVQGQGNEGLNHAWR